MIRRGLLRVLPLFLLLLLLLILVYAGPGYALDNREPFDDPEQQAFYERLTKEVRCLVCQNQTIGDSNAPLAKDLRREVWEMVADGQSEEQIKTFLTDRYGDFVLYKPRYGGPAALLWLAPVLLLLLGAIVLWRIVRRRVAMPVVLDDDSGDGSQD
jgi:cytochrome c-type biogenesis protein CcmH